MFWARTKRVLTSYWPILIIFLVVFISFVYTLSDSHYFFYDDFTGFTFSVPRSYTQIVVDSLISKDVDRHKFIGYMVTKGMYQAFGLNVEPYFFLLFVIHLINTVLVYFFLLRMTKRKLISAFLAGIFGYRFYFWWFSNIHALLGGMFSFLAMHVWVSFMEMRKKWQLVCLWALAPLMVYANGATVYVFPALGLLAVYLKGREGIKIAFRYLWPFGAFLLLYTWVYTHTLDSETRFVTQSNPYYRPISILTWLRTQSIYLHELTRTFPQKDYFPVVFWTAAGLILFNVNRKILLFVIAFFIALSSQSFFPNHTMFYYMYVSVIFLLVGVGIIMTKYPKWGVVVALILFNPFYGLTNVIFRLHHPAANFEKDAMAQIIKSVDGGIINNNLEIQMSNWEVTPNLQHALESQAIALFLTSTRKNDFLYQYSRDTQRITLVPKK